jgi:biopolymer transport protein ExbD
MAGLSVDGNTTKRRSLDSEINMIPMIDLLMVTISFLLITAVWVHSQRLDADAKVPGPTQEPPCEDCKEEAKLHVETADPAKFVLAWKQGRNVVRTVDVPRDAQRLGGRDANVHGVAFPALAAKIADEHRATGVHREASDRRFDRAVVHTGNETPYSEIIAVMDAVSYAKRPLAAGGKTSATQAFDITFATD